MPKDARIYAERYEHINAHKFSEIKRLSRLENQVYTMGLINPDFGKRPGATTNCTLCSVAYELRRRGYDVEANESVTGRDTTELAADIFYEVEDQYKDLEDEQIKCTALTKDELIAALESNMPDGARGLLSGWFTWSDSNAPQSDLEASRPGSHTTRHCVAWEKINGHIL